MPDSTDTTPDDSTPKKKRATKKRPTAKKATKKKTVKKKSPKKTTKKAWTFPKNPLEEAIAIPKAIEEKNGGHPMNAPDLAKAVGYKQAQDWRFLDLLKSANQYGLVSGSGKTAKVTLEKIGEDIVAPSSSTQRQEALFTAFHAVDDFQRVSEFYGGKRIPEDEYFTNTLAREFGIDRDRLDIFSAVFRENLEFLGSFDAHPKRESGESNIPPSVKPESEPSTSAPSRVREFLDTCFVMMPFGEWFDRYYQDIYIPAIKEAGFEPVRADELFTTGSVVEQIWEQIEKSKVLLADLTGKNPNVFYELGLAHAACKPVVFTAGQLDDVPFDLRHLRVIVYDVREPDWAAKLHENITEYLKNAKTDPEKSIPQPFRQMLTDDAAE